jgi:bacteriocin biosynthesis cyclodehydratase domain-containing protein
MMRPRFRADYVVDAQPFSPVILLSELSPVFLNGPIYAELAPLLDGRHEMAEIVDRMEATASPPEVYYALMQLASAGHIADAAEDADLQRPEQAYWDVLQVGSAMSERALERASLKITALGAIDPLPIASALETVGVAVVDEGKASLEIVAVDDYLHRGLASVNRAARDRAWPWLLTKPVGQRLWIGPLFSPAGNGCWECLAQRLRSHRQAERFLEQSGGGSILAEGLTVSSSVANRMSGALLAAEVVMWIAASPHSKLADSLLTFDLVTAQMHRHVFFRRPQCRICGAPEYRTEGREPARISLRSRPKQFAGMGGCATRTPEEALAAYQPHLSPITGVIAAVHAERGVPGLLYGHLAVHDFPLWKSDFPGLIQNLRGRSGGQGTTEAESELSAVGEAIERYSGVWRGEDEITVHATRRSLDRSALKLEDCLLFSESQLAQRDTWNAAQTIPNHLVPKLLAEDLEIDWTPVRSLNDGSLRLVPTAFCYYGHPDTLHSVCYPDSNGCAAGNTLEEAILTGLVELIERDAVAIWWYNRLRRNGVSLQASGLDYAERLSRFYRGVGRDLEVVDISSDLGIPCFAASSARLDGEPEDLLLGFGAHPDPRRALMRALCELNQSYPVVSGRDVQDQTVYATANADTIHWLTTATRSAQEYLRPDPDMPVTALTDFPSQPTTDIRDDIERVVAAIAQCGIATYVLDQTRPDVGIPVCRVIAPGLRHFWRRLGPGRLYDVPVRMGWLQGPKTEAELNPFSIFF